MSLKAVIKYILDHCANKNIGYGFEALRNGHRRRRVKKEDVATECPSPNNNNKTSKICTLPSCSYDEHICSELLHLVTRKLDKQIRPMLNSAYSKAVAKSKASVAFVGLTSILAEAAGVILQLAEHEAYGIRGASIVLKLRSESFISKQNPDGLRTLGNFEMDNDTVSTFELTLILNEEKDLGLEIRNWFKSIFRTKSKKSRIMSPKFSVRKRRLFC